MAPGGCERGGGVRRDVATRKPRPVGPSAQARGEAVALRVASRKAVSPDTTAGYKWSMECFFFNPTRDELGGGGEEKRINPRPPLGSSQLLSFARSLRDTPSRIPTNVLLGLLPPFLPFPTFFCSKYVLALSPSLILTPLL